MKSKIRLRLRLGFAPKAPKILKTALLKNAAEFSCHFCAYFFSGENTFCVVAEKMLIKVRNIVSKGVYDVVKVDWLLRCIEQQQLLPWYVDR